MERDGRDHLPKGLSFQREDVHAVAHGHQQSACEADELVRRVRERVLSEREAVVVTRRTVLEHEHLVLAVVIVLAIVVILPRPGAGTALSGEHEHHARADGDVQGLAMHLHARLFGRSAQCVVPFKHGGVDRRAGAQIRDGAPSDHRRWVGAVLLFGLLRHIGGLRGEEELAVAARQTAWGVQLAATSRHDDLAELLIAQRHQVQFARREVGQAEGATGQHDARAQGERLDGGRRVMADRRFLPQARVAPPFLLGPLLLPKGSSA
mmetsp:Transcript_43354/g.140625  ORF Transcript_43354/g.140625 Transcript_43354/m.140625 type:complete len:265 (-) Transcript_43354:406-1200(-)